MNKRIVDNEKIRAFRLYLASEEKSAATLEKYTRDVRSFAEFSGSREIDKELVLDYKREIGSRHAPSSVNSMLAAINTFLRFCGWSELCVKRLRVQRQVFCSEKKELTRAEYCRLIKTAEQRGKYRLGLIIQTICATGIRVSELCFITAEAVERGEACVRCKGKNRTVFIVPKLRQKLLLYIRKQKIKTGPVFITKSGRAVSRNNIWREMKGLCADAEVSPEKVFPHNLRHLFARTFYNMEKDIAKLADILGHSSINTTRLYIMTSGAEHREKMKQMRLII